jgi:3-hydroxybutyryl-CoA dehydratase
MSVYDDLALDREFVSGARTISADDVAEFAALTGDASGVHLDDRAAEASPYGRRIAHGMLTLSCSVGLATRMNLFADALIAFAGLDRLRFTSPVFIGDTIVVYKRVVEARAVDSSRGLVTFDTRVVNQRGDIVVAYVDRYLLRR